MKQLTIVFLFALFGNSMLAQTEEKALKMSVQTDLISYTTNGGYSIWYAIQHHQNKLSLAYVNFPNRYADYYEESGLQERDQIFRVQYARYFSPESKMKDFFYGANLEYHIRTLEEDNNASILEDTGYKLAPIFGYEFHTFRKKENALNNLSFVIWAGPTFLFDYKDELVFANTGSVYEARESIEVSVGVLISYTFLSPD